MKFPKCCNIISCLKCNRSMSIQTVQLYQKLQISYICIYVSIPIYLYKYEYV